MKILLSGQVPTDITATLTRLHFVNVQPLCVIFNKHTINQRQMKLNLWQFTQMCYYLHTSLFQVCVHDYFSAKLITCALSEFRIAHV